MHPHILGGLLLVLDCQGGFLVNILGGLLLVLDCQGGFLVDILGGLLLVLDCQGGRFSRFDWNARLPSTHAAVLSQQAPHILAKLSAALSQSVSMLAASQN